VLWYGTPEAIKAIVSQSGAEQINALVAQGRAVIGLAPHFIGLDAAATRLTMEVPSSATLYTPQGDPAIEAVMCAGRKRFNTVFLVRRADGVRELLRHLRERRPVYYLPDMDFGPHGATFAPFFGVPAATLLATAQLARKWNAAVLPILSFWDPASGRYHIEVLAPLQNFPGDDSLEAATMRLNREIETWVRRCPSQYYWVHRRFKTRPVGEPKFY
jgi:KDO2-lipid IV(A) lauroyltransferase